MDQEYDDLVRRATRGDSTAQAELMKLAEKQQEEHRLEDAVRAFRDAAIAFRIAAFRNDTRAGQAEGQRGTALQTVEIYRRWLAANPRGMRPLPRASHEFEFSVIMGIVNQLLDDPGLAPIFGYLFDELSSLGVQFSSPGGTIQRRVAALLSHVFSDEPRDPDGHLEVPAIRVGIDLLADEVERIVVKE